MKHLTTIEPIIEIYETRGSQPALVRCDDNNLYVCKHIYHGTATKLFYELLASKFLVIWEIPTPDIAFINVKDNHRINNAGLPYSCFSKTCFGSQKLITAVDVDSSFVEIHKSKADLEFKCNLLNIALFDMWLSNEDRLLNNPNLLISRENERYVVYAIDHSMCFNSGSGETFQLTFEDSIMAHDLIINHVRREREIIELKDDFFKSFHENVEKCKFELDVIGDLIPSDWNIDFEQMKEYILKNVFSDDWLEKTKNNFKQTFMHYIKKGRKK